MLRHIRLASRCLSNDYKNILVTNPKPKVALIQLNRPKALNALSPQLLTDLDTALKEIDQDDTISCTVLTGNERAFAAGADIKQLKHANFSNLANRGTSDPVDAVRHHQKPVIAAVNGLALGGGCEVMMMCDIAYAGSKALFGQPEILLGTIPGAGGTQRIAKSASKSLAMEMNLTGDMKINAQQALQAGLVSKVCPPEDLVEEALKTAERIAKNSPLILKLCKEAVNKAYELSLGEGLEYERRLFHGTFATKDRAEGMAAFVEKRKAEFSNE